MIAAASNGQVAAIEFLLEKGADLEAGNRLGNTPLLAAAQRNNTLAVDSLLENGANTQAKNFQNQTFHSFNKRFPM